MKSWIKKFVRINPLKSFTELPIFWGTFISLSILALISTILIIINSNLEWLLDYKGFNYFVEIFKVPLSIMALMITFVAILATMHRSSQTKELIIITNKQNSFSNYYKHIEEFEKYMDSVFSHSTVICKNLRLTHRYLFPNSVDGDYSIDRDFLFVIENKFSVCKYLLTKFNQDGEYSVHKLIFETYLNIDNVFSLLHMQIDRGGKRLNVDGKMIVAPEFIKGFIYDIISAASILIQILSFDHLIFIPSSLMLMTKLNPSVVPDWNIFTQNKADKFDVFSNE